MIVTDLAGQLCGVADALRAAESGLDRLRRLHIGLQARAAAPDV